MDNCTKIFIFDTNKNSREILKSYLEEFNLNCEIKLIEDYSIDSEAIKSLSENSIVFIDISDFNFETKNILETLRLQTSKIVVTSTNYSTASIIKAMRYGAKDFLHKPVLKDELKRSVDFLYNAADGTVNGLSKIITIYSNKGGVGKTTIASNLAYELARVTHDKVALIDLNLQLGDISTFLNLQPTFDVAYVIKNLLRKNSENILNAFEKYENTNLYVLSDPNYIEQSESITIQEIEEFLNILKKLFPYIIIDMSANIDPNSLKILDKSDWIMFTTIVNIPAIRNAQRCLNLFNSRRYPNDKVKIIVNRFMENEEIKVNDIEAALGEKIYWKIPNNYFSIMEAINKGVPVSYINPNSNIANSFRELSIKVSDDFVEKTIYRYRGK